MKTSCRFCGSTLRGQADMTWPEGGVLVADCPRCGTYQLLRELIPTVDALSADARAEIQDYLQTMAAVGEPTPTRLGRAFFGIS